MKPLELVLVVDDSKVIRSRMKNILERNGYDVILREDGEAGVLAALEYGPDLIIMDLNMPRMDGFTASSMLKRYPQTRNMPIAVFTDENETQRKVDFFGIGVEDFILKDADEAEVTARVGGLLRWKKNRDNLAQENNKLGNIIDILSDLVIIFDTAGKLVFYNRAAGHRFRLIPELIQEKTILEILPAAGKVRDLCRYIDTREEIHDQEVEIDHGETGVRHYMADINRIYIGLSEDVGGAFILRDITGEKEAQRLKTEFYSMMAHEMRTPISVVLGYTQLILDGRAGEISALQQEFLRGVEEKGKVLIKLVNDFLEVSRLENKFIRLDPSVFDISILVTETVSGIRLLAENKNISLTCGCRGVPILLRADRDKLEHVMINLVENAIKYTEENGTVTVRCGVEDGGAVIEIEDTGIGMSGEELKFIFDRFTRAGNAEKKKIKGTGLGLAIVKEIVDAHKGRIDVESQDGKGSVFRLWIPGVVERPDAPAGIVREVEIPVPDMRE